MNNINIGWIGLGNMGRPMAKHLIDAGFGLSVFNHNKAKDLIARDMGASVAGTIDVLSESCRVIFLMVPDDNAVHEIFEGAGGLFSSTIQGKIFINMSTVSPDISRDISEKCLRMGAYYIAAPVSGSVKQANEASLVIMVDGKEDIFLQVKPLLEKLGKLVLYLGEAGKANTLKLVINTMLAIYAQSLAEAIVFAESNNIDIQNLLTAFNNGAMANIFTKLKGDLILNDDYNAAFALKHIVKDLGLAKNMGLDSPLGNASYETYKAANERYAEEDMIAIYKYLK